MPRFVSFVAIVAFLGVAPPAGVHAQTSGAASTARQTPVTLGFLNSFRFHLNALRLVSNSDNFVWDTDFGGDFDVFDLKYFRGNVLVNVESIVGRQLRAIDPNQINYTVDLSVWWRAPSGWGELGGTFHHVSRHLSDREKAFAVAWNNLGLQYVHAPKVGAWELDLRGRGLWNIQRSFVDYAGEVGGSVEAAHPLGRWVTVLVGGEATMVPVSRRVRGRDTLVGSRIEVGVRFPGGAGVGEVFVARERRIDADPFDLEPTTFTTLGFRFRGL
jgi:hypothetical protein